MGEKPCDAKTLTPAPVGQAGRLSYALKISGLSKRFGTVQALDGIDLEIFPGEVHALVGENGAGKSTLINLLVGTLQPDAGKIVVNGSEMRFRNARAAAGAGIAAVFQELSVVNSLSVAENIFANRQPINALHFVRWNQLRQDTQAILQKFGIALSPETLVENLSVAERQVVEILKCLSANPTVLLLDEPTSSLTEREKAVLFGIIKTLRTENRAIIYISHHLPEVLELADRVTVLRDGKRVATKLRKEIDEAEMVRLMVGRELSDIYGKQRSIDRTWPPRIRVQELSRRGVFEKISLEIYPGEIVGVAGLVGAGRTEVGRAIFGAEPISAGSIYLNEAAVRVGSPAEAMAYGIAYVSEDRKTQGLFLRHSIRENLVAPRLNRFSSRGGFMQDDKIDSYAEAARSRSRIVSSDLHQAVGRLSGGNQQKVLMGAWIGLDPRVLIADEPTRGVDVGARLEIYAQLRELASRGAAVLLISSDLQEVLGLSDRILVMRAGGIVERFNHEDATEEKIIAAALGAKAVGANP